MNVKKKFKLTLAYEGTCYFGWQKTRMGPSIEGAIEAALHRILQEKIILEAASRTDRGVHAEAQVAHFETNKEPLDVNKLKIGLNALLPPDIRVLSLEESTSSFHATLDSVKKEYHYYLYSGPILPPFKRNFVWHFPFALNLDEMAKAAKDLIGPHDFSSFTNVKKPLHKTKVRELFSIHIHPLSQEEFRFEIVGDHFLYKMARNIVGTLAYIGAGKLMREELIPILLGKDRKRAGMTAPASGLFLKRIYY